MKHVHDGGYDGLIAPVLVVEEGKVHLGQVAYNVLWERAEETSHKFLYSHQYSVIKYQPIPSWLQSSFLILFLTNFQVYFSPKT